MHFEGLEIAAGIVPAYEVGGDWYDYAQNDDGIWVAVADAVGKGSKAAGASSVALGALRAARCARLSLAASAQVINAAVADLEDDDGFVTAVLAHWQPQTSVLRWLRFGHPLPIMLAADGSTEELDTAAFLPLGLLGENAPLQPTELTLEATQRFVITSDGVWERRDADGRLFGLAGIQQALRPLAGHSAAATATALVSAVIGAAPAPPRDDATVLVLAPS